jgi:hypothetical protein
VSRVRGGFYAKKNDEDPIMKMRCTNIQGMRKLEEIPYNAPEKM